MAISNRLKNNFEDALVDHFTIREIDRVFENSDIENRFPDESLASGQRRSLVKQYYKSIDWSNSQEEKKALEAFSAITATLDEKSKAYGADIFSNTYKKSLDQILSALEKDRLVFDDNTHTIQSLKSSTQLREPEANPLPNSSIQINPNPFAHPGSEFTNNGATQPTEKVPTVFISYSWDDEPHKAWVNMLAHKLSEKGVHVILDQFDLHAGKSMTHFMEKAVAKSDKVLCILTPNYKIKSDDRTVGVGFEYSMISHSLFLDQGSEKFIPVLRNPEISKSTPTFLASLVFLDMSKETEFENSLDQLVKIIHGEPITRRPELGLKPDFFKIKTGEVFKSENSIINSQNTLIDIQDNLNKSRMPYFADWQFDIICHSLNHLSNPQIYNAINSQVIIDPVTRASKPYILTPQFRLRAFPNIEYKSGLHSFLAANHFVEEALSINNHSITYEFSEYNDQSMLLLFLVQPLETILHLCRILSTIHTTLDLQPNLEINISFKSNIRSILYQNYLPIPTEYSFDTYHIPDQNARSSFKLTTIDTNSLSSLLENFFGIFVSENPKSAFPFIRLKSEETKNYLSGFFH